MTDEGLDLAWVVDHGALMSWEYALLVEPALNDLDAACERADFVLCVDVAAVVLRSVVIADLAGQGLRTPADPIAFHAMLAVHDSPAAGELRDLPLAVTAGRADAELAVRAARTQAEHLRAVLPFELPVLRSRDSRAPTIRATRTLLRLRDELGLGPVDWPHEGT